MNLAINDLLPTLAFRPDMRAGCGAAAVFDGEALCMRAFARLQDVPPGYWMTLPVCGTGALAEFAAVMQAALDAPVGAATYAAVAAEAERSLERGVRGATPHALLLLAALAAGAGADADGARTLAETALALAARLGPHNQRAARNLHAALVAPYVDAPERAATELATLCDAETPPSYVHRYLAGNGFITGMALSELSDRVHRAAGMAAAGHASTLAAELAERARLLAVLTCADAPSSAQGGCRQPRHLNAGIWIARLQAAFLEDDLAFARHAADQAARLASPLQPIGDRVAHHLFAALAWSRSNEPLAGARLELHCAALRRLAPHPRVGPWLRCAEAARACQGGDRLGALRGFEEAAGDARHHGRHVPAALAWEQAARLAETCGLAAAAEHYHGEALAGWEQAGAAGRAARLRAAWGIDADGVAERERERILRAGRVGELGLSIAHEVNQPLAAIALHAAAARKWLRRSEPDIERALSSLSLISAAGQHAGDIVRSVQQLASRKEQDMGSVPVDRTIGDTVRLLHRLLRKHAIEVELELGLGDSAIHASRVQLQQVLTNLLVNAAEALAAGNAGAPTRKIRIASRRCGTHEIEVAVSDNGPGIAPQLTGRVFGSLFSTKPGSTGMGLSISLAIVRAHGGHIEYVPCEPHGACFRFRLPVRSGRP